MFTWTSRTKVNRRQGKSSLLVQVTCVHMDIQNKSEQGGDSLLAQVTIYVFTWTSRTKVNKRHGKSSLLAQVTMCSHGHPEQK